MENNFILSEKEKKILTSLYKIGEASVWRIAKDNGINRTTIYPLLEKLIEKGLVSKVGTNKKDIFRSISKEDLKSWTKKRTKQIEKENQQIIELAENKNKKPSLLSEVSYFEGLNGIRNLYADSWRDNKEKKIYCITDYESAYKNLGSFFEKEYFPARLRHNVKVKNLIPESKEGREKMKTAKEMLREMKFIKIFENLGIEINIYDSKTSIILLDKKKPSGVIIKNEKIAEAMKNIFDYLWKTAK
jgi:sugar-specific transcriptional regulator TrmB